MPDTIRTRRQQWPALLGGLGLLLLSGISAAQDEDNRAGLVVSYGSGEVEAACVAYAEESISGLELLQRSGLAAEIDYQSSGAAACRIDQTGCPADDCFCQCAGGADCIYWSYWQQNDDTWQYAAIGAHASRVRHGDVEGWSWGPGSVTDAIEPPATTFEAICSGDVVAAQPAVAAAPDTDATKDSLPVLIAVGVAALGAVVVGTVLAAQRSRTR